MDVKGNGEILSFRELEEEEGLVAERLKFQEWEILLQILTLLNHRQSQLKTIWDLRYETSDPIVTRRNSHFN